MKVPKELQIILDIFPLPKPDRVVEQEGIVLAEWHLGEDYFEIEYDEGDITVMTETSGKVRHWTINRV